MLSEDKTPAAGDTAPPAVGADAIGAPVAAGAPATAAPDRYRMVDPYSDAGRREVRRARMPLYVLVCVVVVAVLALGGFYAWNTLRPPDIAAYAEQPITLVNLQGDGGELVVTPQTLSELPCEQLSAEGKGQGPNGSSKAGTVNAYGPTLKTLLESYGYEPTDFGRIIFQAKDGYSVILTGNELGYEVILSIAQGKDALFEQQQPMRLVIPQAESGKWTYGVEKIEFNR